MSVDGDVRSIKSTDSESVMEKVLEKKEYAFRIQQQEKEVKSQKIKEKEEKQCSITQKKKVPETMSVIFVICVKKNKFL